MVDSGVTLGTVYYYKLEELEVGGRTNGGARPPVEAASMILRSKKARACVQCIRRRLVSLCVTLQA